MSLSGGFPEPASLPPLPESGFPQAENSQGGAKNEVSGLKADIATIKEKSLTKAVLEILKEKYPISQSLRHLKRIRSSEDHLQVIITEVLNVEKKHDLESDLELCKFLEHYKVALVASVSPLTRKQFTQASEYWPTNFYEDKYVTKLIEGKVFTEKEELKHKKCLELVDETAYCVHCMAFRRMLEKRGTLPQVVSR